ncbi:MAG TPA: alpha/beta fold hydrolase [Burkholderiaceae bacterium]|nr:alpha/beta fold hydrolase [Burkholderiaceae bacterium]HPH13681.1 alpha/beta fold hydrolase [Burkholderiaceae bacterium]
MSSSTTILLLPGWQNSGPRHWQSMWEREHGYTRVDQHEWMRPRRGDWIARLEEVLLTQTGPAVLVAHSLGCHLVSAWAAHSSNTHLVKCAFLVAPADVERDEMRSVLPSWSPISTQALPFKSLLLASQNDPYCSFERSQALGSAWGSAFVDCGRSGHINAEAGLDVWPQGHAALQQLLQST